MIRTKIKFEDIRAGDLLEVVSKQYGVKSVFTGIAFELDEDYPAPGSHMWKTAEGGFLVITEDDDTIYRVDVREVKFEDIQWGDRIQVSGVRGDVERVFRGRVVDFMRSDASWYDGWATDDGTVLVRRRDEYKIEILERGV